MIYFTISDIYPAQQNRVIYVDNSTALNYVPVKRTMKFGDGYELSIPITTLHNFSTTFSNRPLEEIEVIDEYLTRLKGSTIPNFSIMGTIIPMVCISFSKTYQNVGVATLNAEFSEIR